LRLFVAGDIIKTTLSKARENNKVNCAKTMILSLISKFREMKEQQVPILLISISAWVTGLGEFLSLGNCGL
jgi:hypothetical protein